MNRRVDGLLILAFLLSASQFFPRAHAQLWGWGEDPYFNLWHFEWIWRQLTDHGVLSVFRDSFWKTPIFGGQDLTLALSENQIFAALLSWPLRLQSGDGAWTMSLFGWLQHEAGIALTWWALRVYGFSSMAGWGALLFCLSGWFQSQYAHAQHFCLFVFPLALGVWGRFRRAPHWGGVLCCALAWGWVCGWNLYFQVMLNAIFVFFLVEAWIHRPSQWSYWLSSAVGVGLLQLPFLIQYKRLEMEVGSLAVSASDFFPFSAKLSSFLARPERISWLQKWLPFYPHPRLGIEASGFLGLIWCGLVYRALRSQAVAVFWKQVGFAALFFYGVSLGPDGGVFYLLKSWLPGMGALRAVGRFQWLVFVFSLPLVLAYLRTLSLRWRRILMMGICIELCPADAPRTVAVDPHLFGRPSDFVLWLQEHGPEEAFVPIPFSDVRFQLSMLGSPSPLFWGGYSGRTPLGVSLIGGEIQKSLHHREPQHWEHAAAFAAVRRVAVWEDQDKAVIRQFLLPYLPHWKEVGCWSHWDAREVCLFEREGSLPPAKTLDEEKDFTWKMQKVEKGFEGHLLAQTAGVLNWRRIGRCFLQERVDLKPGVVLTRRKNLPGWLFRDVVFSEGEEVFSYSTKTLLKGFWPQEQSFALRCSE